MRYELDESRRLFKLKFDSLPPHATWVLEWQLNHESDVEVVLSPFDARTPGFLVGENGILQAAAFFIPSTVKEGRNGWSSTPRPLALVFCLFVVFAGYWMLQLFARMYATTALDMLNSEDAIGWAKFFLRRGPDCRVRDLCSRW